MRRQPRHDHQGDTARRAVAAGQRVPQPLGRLADAVTVTGAGHQQHCRLWVPPGDLGRPGGEVQPPGHRPGGAGGPGPPGPRSGGPGPPAAEVALLPADGHHLLQLDHRAHQRRRPHRHLALGQGQQRDRGTRPLAEQPDRSVVQRQLAAQRRHRGRELGEGLLDHRAGRLARDVLGTKARELLLAAGGRAGGCHRQAQVHPPGRQPGQGQRRGHRLPGPRGVQLVPGHHQRCPPPPASRPKRHVRHAGRHPGQRGGGGNAGAVHASHAPRAPPPERGVQQLFGAGLTNRGC